MARKKKFNEEQEEITFTNEPKEPYVKKLLPSHWGREEGLDGALFAYWDKFGIVDREGFDNIKKLVSSKI